MTDKLRILLDMDSILADFLGGLWDRVEAVTGLRPTTADVEDFYKMEAALNPEMKAKLTQAFGIENTLCVDEEEGLLSLDSAAATALMGLFHEPGFFAGLDVIRGSQDVVNALLADGHEVVVVSAPSSTTSPAEKIEWLARHFPGIDRKNVFIGSHKHMVQGDVLVDDALHNARAYRQHWPESLIVTLAYPYNCADNNCPYDGRYGGLTQTAWLKIYAAIAVRAGTV